MCEEVSEVSEEEKEVGKHKKKWGLLECDETKK